MYSSKGRYATDKNIKKGGLFSLRKYKPLFIETHRTTRGVLVLNLYFRVSGKIGLGASGGRPFFTVSESSRKG